MKKLFVCAFGALCLTSLASGQEGETPQQLAQRLFDPQITQEQLKETLKKAGMAGIPRQQMIEAKLIWGLRRQDTAWLVALLPELEVVAQNFDPTQSAGLRSADEIKAFIAYTKALQADAANDEAAFKRHILEAVWLNPQQAQIFTQVIDQRRRALQMETIVIDLTLPVTTSTGEATTLGDLMEGKKAILIDFWAAKAPASVQLLPEFKKTASHLAAHDLVAAGMNRDDTQPLPSAEEAREQHEIDFPWLIEPAERPFTKLLGIESLPRVVLISSAGKVLYNGHPQDPNLWKALKKLDSAIIAPEAEPR